MASPPRRREWVDTPGKKERGEVHVMEQAQKRRQPKIHVGCIFRTLPLLLVHAVSSTVLRLLLALSGLFW